MAHVALSRVCSLSRLHLIEFHSKSLIMVSPSCLKEVNRLREKYRPVSPTVRYPSPEQKSHKAQARSSEGETSYMFM